MIYILVTKVVNLVPYDMDGYGVHSAGLEQGMIMQAGVREEFEIVAGI